MLSTTSYICLVAKADTIVVPTTVNTGVIPPKSLRTSFVPFRNTVKPSIKFLNTSLSTIVKKIASVVAFKVFVLYSNESVRISFCSRVAFVAFKESFNAC